jgi:hypothetical protein
MFNSALTRGTELDKARQETIKNLAPSIFEEMKANPNVPVQDLLVKYAQQYEVDPLTLSSNLIQYKSDREKEDLLTQKANLDLLSSKVNLLKDSGASGEIDIPGIGKVDIQKKGDFSLVQAGNSMYVFDKDTGKVQSTGLNTDQLSSNNILDAIQGLAKGDYQNPGVAVEAILYIRKTLADMWGRERALKTRIIYGASVTPENAAAFAKEKNIQGLLPGRASVNAEEFTSIIKAFS